MAAVILAGTGIPLPETGRRAWAPMLRDAVASLNAMGCVSPLAVRSTTFDADTGAPTGLGITVAAGSFLKPNGRVVSYGGGTATVTDAATTYVWLTTAGVLAVGAAFPAAPYVPLASVVAAGGAVTLITDARLLFGTVAPAVPAGANQAALTDSTGGTPSFTLAAVGNTSTGDQSAVINADIASLARLVNQLRADLVSEGVIKGSA